MQKLTIATFFWYIFPVLLLFVSSIIIKKMSLERKYGVKAPDIATPFLLVGIHYLSKMTFDESFLPYTLLIVLLVSMLIAVFQAYQFKEIKYKRYLKMVWRIVFLITLLIYFLLIIASIILYLN
ncbi:DUF3397 domain-containing protein [Vagococcus carniphilus]|uniref:DUF3397 domain-containing protein n=1 Tax=Vagococcus carniphilus TaxID=218144 RepID=UPI00288D645F|nr:DUF3397 domain-containing protein [Vagococcus carniphilus]MDT2813867.1 DUF3397 domain-containing protein [Vagococcus carniphilus]MDT2829870.1 DUF3397 domain-containing protein [Vagococcus carniphilus]MDT2838304.1 DUF3397 domain-containing protein [Vagococcus carniphilus]MDT2850013.1 DUF3397 domain-containing protein [Vagococcus carniphilus]MDT2854300.1 DUF3397 domain-containing protein [Vagococcus carniphilus]